MNRLYLAGIKVMGGLFLAVAVFNLWAGREFYAALDLAGLMVCLWAVYSREGWTGRKVFHVDIIELSLEDLEERLDHARPTDE